MRTLRLILSIGLIALIAGPVFGASPAGPDVPPVREVTVDQGAQDPAPSPDGNTIALSILGKIWLLPAAGGGAREVTRGIGWDAAPTWSPDGRFLAYSHQLASGCDIVVYNLSTGQSSFVYHNEGTVKQIRYNPAGSEVFFLLERSQLDCHLWRMPLAGGEAKPLTFTQNRHEWSFALSPDGHQVLLQSGRYGGSDLYLMDLTTQETRRLTQTPAGEFSVDWSRDGKTWVFIRESEGRDTIVTEAAGGGPERELMSSEYDQKEIALFPDGKSAVLTAGRRLFRVDMTSGASSQVPFTATFVLPERSSGSLAIVHANLFDGTGRDVINNATIVVQDGRIVSVREGQPAPEGVEVVDAGGKFVLPGLMDNHYHYWNPFDGAFLLSRGITSIRDPGVPISTSMNFKQAISVGLLPGPSIYSCGPLIDGLNGYHPLVDVELTKPESARPLVLALKAQGVDALKVYFMLKPEVLKEVIKEAHAAGLPVTGHIGVKTSWTDALNAGIDGLNHIRVWKDFLPVEDQPQGEDESLDGSKHLVPRMQADWSKIDTSGTAVGALIRLMATKKVGFDPTLSIQRIDPSLRNQLGLDEYSRAADSYKRMGQFVKRAVNERVFLLAGTDDGNLFDEVEAYADAGVPAKAILLAATANGAKWLGKESSFGTVEPGKAADIVIIDGDPLTQIKDIRKISRVIKAGRVVYSDQKLRQNP
ncbi:MAG TPA: amidohydrolase family protein [Blastocatellia bacterium]|nr:amidohydrolase family protein [Blastocatellia bacterium]